VAAYAPAQAAVVAPAVSAPGPFRTAWVQVPVTVYRPVRVVDPVTGAAVTQQQACTTQRWQIRRVPVSALTQALSPTVTMFAPPQPATIVQPGCATCAPSAPVIMHAPSAFGVAPPAPPSAGANIYGQAPPAAAPMAPSLAPLDSAGGPPVGAGQPAAADLAPTLMRPVQPAVQPPASAPPAPAQQSAAPPAAPALAPLRPVPDPDAPAPAAGLTAPQLEAPTLQAPLLIDPSDRSAAVRVRFD
jgi:hypothetical protein